MNMSAKKIALSFCFILSLAIANGQGITQPIFEIVELPKKLNYDDALLNREIAAFTSKYEVKKLFTQKHFGNAEIVIMVHHTPPSHTFWTVNIGTNQESETPLILQSKNVESDQ